MAVTSVQLLALPGFPLVQPGDDLAVLIAGAMAAAGTEFVDGDVLVVAQKIVSKAEARYVQLSAVTPSARAREIARVVDKDPRLLEVILSESVAVLRQTATVLIVEHRLGFIMANAGVDASNIEHGDGPLGGRVLLLPLDPDASAAKLRVAIRAASGAEVAVIVNDSVGRAWRMGTTSMALGASGLLSLWDRRGNVDLFGRPLQVTEVAVADELAAAASLLQGEASEGQPVVLIRGLRLPAGDQPARTLLRPQQQDLFR